MQYIASQNLFSNSQLKQPFVRFIFFVFLENLFKLFYFFVAIFDADLLSIFCVCLIYIKLVLCVCVFLALFFVWEFSNTDQFV